MITIEDLVKNEIQHENSFVLPDNSEIEFLQLSKYAVFANKWVVYDWDKWSKLDKDLTWKDNSVLSNRNNTFYTLQDALDAYNKSLEK